MLGVANLEFAGMNPIAVVLAAIAGFATGAGWYMILGNSWLDALGKTKDQLEKSPWPFIAAIIFQLVMAFVLAGTIGHVGEVNLSNSLITAGYCWIGFVLPTMFINHRFQNCSMKLTIIDAGHWLAVLLIMGLVIGLLGV